MIEYEESLTAHVAEQRSANEHAWERLMADMHPVEQAIRASIANQLELGITYENTANAVLAVLDLHPPVDNNPYPICDHCQAQGESYPYPCPTVERIADALGVTA